MSITTAGGVQLTTVQNRHGQTVSVADSMGTTTTYAYDGDGRRLSADTGGSSDRRRGCWRSSAMRA
jgi:YD repeat-containing protein